MKDFVILGVLVVSFALLITLHVTLVVGFIRRHDWKRALVALIVVPLAPYWGFRNAMRGRAIAWAASLVVYGVALFLSMRA